MSKPAVPPRSAGQLERSVRLFARQRGIAEKRVRDWISYMALGGRFEVASRERGQGHLFSFKGGVVMELRRRSAARATQDLDLSYLGPEADLVQAIDDAVADGYRRFTFRRSGKLLDMANVNAVRVEIGVRFDGAAWGTVVVDISRSEGHAVEVELVEAFDLTHDFGLAGPQQLPCLSARYQLAHKLHGMTQVPPDGSASERVHDAVDALMLRAFVIDLPSVRKACEQVFAGRQQHSWPPTFAPPAAWAARFAEMATELNLEVCDLESATVILSNYIHDIANAAATMEDARDG